VAGQNRADPSALLPCPRVFKILGAYFIYFFRQSSRLSARAGQLLAKIEKAKAGRPPENPSTDARGLFSLNVKRRNLSARKRAIAAGEAWRHAEAEGRVQKQGGPLQKAQSALTAKPRSYFAKAFEVGEQYVEMGHDLVVEHPLAADAVKHAGDLKEAHNELTLRQGRDQVDARRRRELGRERPDLADNVRAEEMTLDDACHEPAKLKRKSDVQPLNFSKASLSQARTVLAQARPLAEEVRDGFPLNEANEIAMKAKKRARNGRLASQQTGESRA
jgi:hypothetical protein